MGIKAEPETSRVHSVILEARTKEIDAALSQESGMIEGYDDIRTRQLISSIKVLDKERLLIRFKDGTEFVRHIGKETV